MAQEFISLAEAAKMLGITEEQLKQRAQKREVRAFSDGGSFKFRPQDVEDMKRKGGMSSDTDVQLADDFAVTSELPANLGKPTPTRSDKGGSDADVHMVADSAFKLGSASDVDLNLGDDVVKSPSDSEVRLTFDEKAGKSDSFRLPGESDTDIGKRRGPAPGATAPTDIDFKFDDDLGEGFRLEGADSDVINLAGASDSSVDIGQKGGKKGPRDVAKTVDLVGSELGLGGSADSGIQLTAPDDSGILLEGKKGAGGDSEFELNLDSDEGTEELPGFKDAEAPVAAKSASQRGGDDSDFELAIDEEDSEDEGESGSEVVAVDEDSEEDEEEYDEDDFSDEIAASAGAAAGAAGGAALRGGRAVPVVAAPAPWPIWIAPLAGITTLFMLILGMMMYEVSRNAWSYNQPYRMNASLIETFAGWKQSLFGK